MNSDKSKSTEPYRLSIDVSHKINITRSDKYVALSNFSLHYTWKNKKSYTKQ